MRARSILVCIALGALTLAIVAPAQAGAGQAGQTPGGVSSGSYYGVGSAYNPTQYSGLQSTPQTHVTVDRALMARHRALARLGEPTSTSSFPWKEIGFAAAATGALALIGFGVLSFGRVPMRRSSRI